MTKEIEVPNENPEPPKKEPRKWAVIPNPDPYDMKAKKKKHPKADDKNFLEQRGPSIILLCGSDKSKRRGIPGAKCRTFAGQGTEHPGYGRCKFCGGRNKGPSTPALKAKVAKNSTKHGLYAAVLGEREAEIFEDLHENHVVLSLEMEIHMQKAKILGYLEKQQKLWRTHYDAKLQEVFIESVCGCSKTSVHRELEPKNQHCYGCDMPRNMTETRRWVVGNTDDEARRYADKMSKVYFKGADGTSAYHAGTIEDSALDRAINTLGRLVERHARLQGDTGDTLISSINAELRAASQGTVAMSWGQAPAQGRKEE